MGKFWQLIKTFARLVTLSPLRAVGGLLSALSLPIARGAAGVALIIAAVALAQDIGTSTVGRSAEFRPTAVVRHWEELAPQSFKATRQFVTLRMPPWVWSAIAGLFSLPTFAFFTGVAVVFGYFGRRRLRTEIFAN